MEVKSSEPSPTDAGNLLLECGSLPGENSPGQGFAMSFLKAGDMTFQSKLAAGRSSGRRASTPQDCSRTCGRRGNGFFVQ